MKVQRPDGSKTKTCPKCGQNRMLKSYGRAGYQSGFVVVYEDGTREWRNSYCFKCRQVLKKAWRQGMTAEERATMCKRDWERFKERHPDWREIVKGYSDPEKRRAAARKRRAKLLTNPAALERERDYRRLVAWEQRRRAGVPERGPNVDRVDRVKDEGQPRIPRQPFLDWLDEVLPVYGVAVFCELTGISERSISRLRNEGGTTVELDLVDRAFTREGSATLRGRYPNLYEGL